MKEYYDTRAPEYDEWYLGIGRFAEYQRRGWEEEIARLVARIEALAPATTLDVACGTGFLTRHLPGPITALDQSRRMLDQARPRLPDAELICADALPLPFADASFQRVFTSHFYGHLEQPDRTRFLEEARRIGGELVVVDSAYRPEHAPEERQERILNDGSRFQVYKRYFDGPGLAGELGSGEVLHEGDWFVMVRSAASGGGAPASV